VPGRRRQKRTDRSKLDATPPWETGKDREAPAPTEGPFDVRDEPDDEATRVDLGALRVPVVEDYDLRVDLDQAQQVMSATLAVPEGTMQLGVFAAPRNEGIWDDVRGEIAASLARTTEPDGPFGTELHGTLTAEGGARVPVRFIGVDGPRWFLRAMIVGPIAQDAARAKVFEEALRGIVVVRGADPLPVREPVPLHLPPDVELPDGAPDASGA
jgi:hypothetical protein